MKKRRIIVIGGMAAGPSAAAKAARVNPSAEVILFEQTENVSYGICEVPYVISGEIDKEEMLVVYTPERLSQEKSISVKILHRVEKIIPNKHKIVVRNLSNSEIKEYEYDKLILATGASPKKLNIPEEDSRNVFHLRNRDDSKIILNYLKTEKPKRATIIGAGHIGIEMAESFRKIELEVTLIHKYSLPLETLEIETSERILEELNKNKVDFIPNAKIEAFLKSKKEKVDYVLTNRGSFETDMVIVAIGVEPNISLAKSAKLRIGNTGAISVNNLQQTSNEDIYAAGDCSEVTNIVTGKPAYIPLASVASRSAWVAGENAAGGRSKFAGAINSSALRIFDLETAKAGLSSEEAASARFKVVTDLVVSNSKIPLMPGNKKVTIKLVVDQITKRILGANVFGEEGAVARANVLAAAIQNKLTIQDLSNLDLIYSPPYSPLWDPILVSSNSVKKKLS
jgi:NADPH-dependent 2,4-dienoyl-CoA reductase/sulfur reductase-like enzyme